MTREPPRSTVRLLEAVWRACKERGARPAQSREDTSGGHDLMVGGFTPASTLDAFGTPSRNTQENFLSAAAKIGLSLRDIPPCVTFFAPVSVDAEGRFLWNSDRKRAGDFVDLRA